MIVVDHYCVTFACACVLDFIGSESETTVPSVETDQVLIEAISLVVLFVLQV